MSTAASGQSPCDYIRENCANTAVGLIRYLDVYYCKLEGNNGAKAFFIIMSLLLLAYLFIFIGTAAGDYFCPNLNTMATLLGLSENMTGVTFLALGNGAPDLFSTFNAMQQHYFGLAIGELLGAASFITTVVVGLVAITSGFKVAPWPFMRDVCFFLLAILYLAFVLYDGVITLLESLFLMVLYVLYVVSVGVGRILFQRSRQRNMEKMKREREKWQRMHQESDENALIEGAEVTEQAVVEWEMDRDTSPLMSPKKPTDQELGSPMSTRSSQLPRGVFLGDIAVNEYDPWFNKHKTMSANAVRSSRRSFLMPKSSPSLTDDMGRRRSSDISRKRPSVESVTQPINIGNSSRVHFQGIDLTDSEATEEITHLDDSIPANYLATSVSVSPVFNQSVALTSFPHFENVSNTDEIDNNDNIDDGENDIPVSETPRYNSTASLSTTPLSAHVLEHLLPIYTDFGDRTLLQKILGIVSVPTVFMLAITVPVVDIDKDDETSRMRQVEREIFLSRWASPVKRGRSAPAIDNSRSSSRSPIRLPEESTVINDSEDPIRDQALNSYLNFKFPPWQRWLFLTQCFCSSCFVLIGLGLWDKSVFSIGSAFTWGILGALIGVGLLIIAQFFTHPYTRPRWYTAFCFAGFFTAVIWIYLIANEVVAILQALGLIMNISDAILGLTIFAIGNSVSDMVADVSIARMGFPNMAIAACFGGPMLNILLGIGFSSFYYNVRNSEPYPLKFTPILLSSIVGVGVALSSSLIMVPLNAWQGTAKYGGYLICLYVLIMTCNVIIEVTVQPRE